MVMDVAFHTAQAFLKLLMTRADSVTGITVITDIVSRASTLATKQFDL